MTDKAVDITVVERVFEVIKSRRGGDPKVSYSAKLFARGRGKIAQKLGEEAVETIIAALDGSSEEVVSESVDLLFHLLMLWVDVGIKPKNVWAEMSRREGLSGLNEKKDKK